MSASNLRRHPVFDQVDFGVGAWAWGDRLFWGYGRAYQDDDLQEAFQASLAAGITFFDTAEAYGTGKSELLLGRFIAQSSQPVKIATKFSPFPWRLSRSSLLKALRGSLKRLGVSQVDLYQIHMPLPPVTVETWMEAMAEAYQAGLIKAAGVSNYDRLQMQRAYDALIHEGIQLASNQVEYNLLSRGIERSGLLKHCLDLGITVIAYSPLAMGFLTGKFGPENQPSGMRLSRYGTKLVEKIKPLVSLLHRIGGDHAGKTAGQVALNWVMWKGEIPIPGAKNLAQAEQNAGALGWHLTDEEVAMLDEASDKIFADTKKR